MHRTILTAAAAVLVAAAVGCMSNAAPATPTIVVPNASASAATPVPALVLPPTLTAPTAQSPANDQRLTGLTATLVATAATIDPATNGPVQYRFQLFNDLGTLVLDSGLLDAPTWTEGVTLTPNKRYAWKARAEYQGVVSSWSGLASFTTPDQPAAYNRPIGDWQSCASETSKTRLTVCVANAVRPVDSVSDMEVTKRVAWLLRGEGAGLLIKPSGDNIVLWQGYSFSASRVCYPDGHLYKLFIDAGPGGLNAAQFADNDFVDPTLYVPAIDPSKP